MKFITYGGYVWFPIIATVTWLGTLVGLMLLWLIQDNGKKYGSRNATIVFISDVGGAHQELFIPGCVTVFISYTLTLFSERFLRKSDRIPKVLRKRDKFWGFFTVVSGILGGFCLMMLSILDTVHYNTIHWSFTLFFILFVGTSSVCQTIEVLQLRGNHPDRAHLKRNSYIKCCLVSISLVIAVVFGVLYLTCHGKATSDRCNVLISTAGVCEWAVATLLVIYFFTFILDLWPAAKTSVRHQRRTDFKLAKELDEEKEDQAQKDYPITKSQPPIPPPASQLKKHNQTPPMHHHGGVDSVTSSTTRHDVDIESGHHHILPPPSSHLHY